MKQIIVAAILGAVVYFVWQMATWMLIPVHGPTVAALPDEDIVRDALIQQQIESGVYIVPHGNNEEDMMDPESEFMKRHQAGPIFAVYYRKEGLDPMSASVLGLGFLTDLLGVAIVASMLGCATHGTCRSYAKRVGFVTGFGVFLALMGHVSYYNWMHFEAYYTAMFIVDAVVGWLLVGLVVAAIIRPATVAPSGDQNSSIGAER